MTYKITWNEVNLGHMIVETEEEAQEFIEKSNMDDPRFTWKKRIYDIDYVEMKASEKESSDDSTDEDTYEDTKMTLRDTGFTPEELQTDFWDNWVRLWGYKIIGIKSHPLKKAFNVYCEMKKKHFKEYMKEECLLDGVPFEEWMGVPHPVDEDE